MYSNPKTRRHSDLSPDPEPEPYPGYHAYATAPNLTTASDSPSHSNPNKGENTTPLKRQKPPTANNTPITECWDWMVSTGNVHYACSTTAFVEYTPLTKTVRLRHDYTRTGNQHSAAAGNGDDDGAGDELEVVGMGKVILSVESPTPDGYADADSATKSHTITLENVLHIPTAICNGFSPSVYGGGMSCHQDVWVGGSGDGGWIAKPFAGGMRLVLSGGRKGGSEVVDGVGGIGCSFGVCVSPQEWQGIVGCVQG